MKFYLLGFLLTFGLLFSVASSSTNKNDIRTIGLIARAVNNVSNHLLSASRQVHGPGTNILFSPFSISVAMAMLLEGSAGHTKAQIVEALQFQNTASDLQAMRNGFKTLLTSLIQETGEFVLNAENAVLVQENISLKKDFQDALMQYYKAIVENKDFQGNTAGVEQEINDWVRTSTRNEIPQFLSPGSLSPDTIVYLLSAVYFSGNWESQFPKNETRPEKFYLDEQNTVNVDMMNVEATFRAGYIEELNADAIELPYKGSRLSMLLLVPRDVEGLPVIEGQLTADLLENIMYSRMTHRTVTLSMPKIKLEADLKLREVMMEMGVTDVFDQQLANLSNISPQYEAGLYVNSAKHKVTLKVDEEGSKAAAVTGFGIIPLSGFWQPPSPMEIIANRPFMLYIYDWDSRLILFVGTITDPSTKAQSVTPLLGKQVDTKVTETEEEEEEEGQWTFEPSFPVYHESDEIQDSPQDPASFNPFSNIFEEESDSTEDHEEDDDNDFIEDKEEFAEKEEPQWASEPELPFKEQESDDSFGISHEGRNPFNPFLKSGPTGRKASPLIEMLGEDLEGASSDRIVFKGPVYYEFRDD